MVKQHDRNFGLDLARSLAIGSVIVSHFAKQIERVGFWGVELFFGLSGFLIGNILWRSFASAEKWAPLNMLNFWQRRWWRTLPSYYLFLIITSIALYFVYKAVAPVPQFITSLWFGQYIVSPPADFYGVSWSLCIEEWFYLLFPIFLYIFSRVIKKPKPAFAFVIVFFLIGSFIIRAIVAYDRVGDFPIRKLTFCRLDAIAFGVAVAFLSSIFPVNLKARLVSFLIGLVCLVPAFILVHFFSMDYLQPAPMQYLAIVVPLGFSLMLPMAQALPPPGIKFSFFHTCIKKLSLWSYSIYLCHIPVLVTVYSIMISIRDSFLINFLSKIIAFTLTVLISAFLYKYFELPLTQKRPAEFKPKMPKPSLEQNAEVVEVASAQPSTTKSSKEDDYIEFEQVK